MYALSSEAQIQVDPCPQCQPVGRQAAQGSREAHGELWTQTGTRCCHGSARGKLCDCEPVA